MSSRWKEYLVIVWPLGAAAHNRNTDVRQSRMSRRVQISDICYAADGWRERVPLHQLHPLLVHVCLFGRSYAAQVRAAARAALGGS